MIQNWRRRMTKDPKSIKRRVFFKAGVTTVLTITILPFKNIFSKMAQYQKSVTIEISPDSFESFADVAFKYGGEFGGIKPEIRRITNGCSRA